MNTTLTTLSKTVLPATTSLALLTPVEKVLTLAEQYFYYKEQIKNLEFQQEQMRLEAELCHHRIDAQLELEKNKLLKQHKDFVQCLRVIENELKEKHFDKREYRQKLMELTDKIADPNLNTEIRNAMLNSMACYSQLLMQIEQNSHQSLLELIENTSNCLLEKPSNVAWLESK